MIFLPFFRMSNKKMYFSLICFTHYMYQNYSENLKKLIDDYRTIRTKNNKNIGCDTEIEYLNKLIKKSNLRWDNFCQNSAIHLTSMIFVEKIENEYNQYLYSNSKLLKSYSTIKKSKHQDIDKLYRFINSNINLDLEEGRTDHTIKKTTNLFLNNEKITSIYDRFLNFERSSIKEYIPKQIEKYDKVFKTAILNEDEFEEDFQDETETDEFENDKSFTDFIHNDPNNVTSTLEKTTETISKDSNIIFEKTDLEDESEKNYQENLLILHIMKILKN